MILLNKISFTYPYFFIFFLFIPFLIKFLKTSPLKPVLKKFPSIIFLAHYKSIDQKADTISYPIVILRLLIIIFLIIALSDPIINEGENPNKHDLIVLDNGWSSSTTWNERKKKIIELIGAKQNNNYKFSIITTTEHSKNQLLKLNNSKSSEGIDFIKSLEPFSWIPNYNLVKKNLEKSIDSYDKIYWFTDKLINNDKKKFYEFLEKFDYDIITGHESSVPPILKFYPINEILYKIDIIHHSNDFSSGVINCFDENNRLIYRHNYSSSSYREKNFYLTKTQFSIPNQIKDKVSYFQLNNINSISAKVFLSKITKKKKIGIANNSNNENSNFKRGNYYTQKALEKKNIIKESQFKDLLEKNFKIIFVDDTILIKRELEEKALSWVKNGGTLIKFGGANLLIKLTNSKENLFQKELSLSKVETTLDSKLSFKKSLKIKKELDITGKLYGIDYPNEVFVKKYIQLKNNYLLNNIETWLTLENGAPLISSSKIEKGRIIFFHIPLNNDWSNFSLSYSFIDTLQRIINLSKGIDSKKERVFKPFVTFNGIGEHTTPSPQVLNIESTHFLDKKKIDYKHPPGIYKDSEGTLAINFGNNFDYSHSIFQFKNQININNLLINKSLSLRPIIFFIIFILFIIDTIITLYYRGLIRFDEWLKFTKVSLFFFFLISSPLYSQDFGKEIDNTSIGYIKTNNKNIDEISKNGLSIISEYITSKTASILDQPKIIDIEKDDLFFFPLIYWPIIEKEKKIDDSILQKINRFLKDGGLFLVDCKMNFSSLDLEECIINFQNMINFPRYTNFSKLNNIHGISKSFYLINSFPGVNNNEVYFSENNSSFNDNATSIIIGNNDWSSSWSKKKNGDFLFPLMSNSQKQRVTSFRFGVNVLIYALTGNYKTDQVHVPEILKRIKK